MGTSNSDSTGTTANMPGEQPDRRLLLLRALIDENATIDGDVVEIDVHTWAIHGVIPVDGDVLMAEYDTYDQAKLALDSLSVDPPGLTPP
jgi:hypothetical protein